MRASGTIWTLARAIKDVRRQQCLSPRDYIIEFVGDPDIALLRVCQNDKVVTHQIGVRVDVERKHRSWQLGENERPLFAGAVVRCSLRACVDCTHVTKEGRGRRRQPAGHVRGARGLVREAVLLEESVERRGLREVDQAYGDHAGQRGGLAVVVAGQPDSRTVASYHLLRVARVVGPSAGVVHHETVMVELVLDHVRCELLSQERWDHSLCGDQIRPPGGCNQRS